MVERKLNDLARKHPDSIYAAFYSLPELRSVFVAAVGEDENDPWSARPPSGFAKKLEESQKKDLTAKVAAFLGGLDEESRGRTMHAIRSWCDADGLFGYAMEKCSSNDRKFEALYFAAATRGVFDSLGEEKRSRPDLLGEKLTAPERAALYLQALNAVAQMSERGQLAYFHEVFGYWSEKLTAEG